VPAIGIGSQPIDDGNYLFTPSEKQVFLATEAGASAYFYRWIGSEEFLNGIERWVLWLGNCPPHELRRMPLALARVDAVRLFRSRSHRKQTLSAAQRPATFGTQAIPTKPYLVVPKVSSERRAWIPMAMCDPATLCSDLVFMLPNAGLLELGVLSSTMHNAWVRAVGGRLKSDYRYSATIVYNNFPWPEPSETQQAAIEAAAQGVLDARLAFPGSTLADLYDPLTMPPLLARAHQKLDVAVDSAYSRRQFRSDAERVAFLFERYEVLASAVTAVAAKSKRRKPTAS
jgi:hypothetical protein